MASLNTDEELPYNESNILISDDEITNLLVSYGITMKFCNSDYYRNAFVHKSYCTRKNENFLDGNKNCSENCIALQENSNERLEFLGDSILGTVVANYLYERYPMCDEGFLTKMRTKIVNGTMLAFLSKHIGLDKYILISRQIENNDGRNNNNILEDTFEAFIGSIYLDFNNKNINSKKMDNLVGLGFQCANKFIINVIERYIDFAELVNTNQNYKDVLIKHFQYKGQSAPLFEEIDIQIKKNKKEFTIAVKSNGLTIGIGKAETKKKSEQIASRNALKYLCVIKDTKAV
jgi:ribonuclease-3